MRHFFVINLHSFRSKTGKLQQILQDIETCFSGACKTAYKIYMSRYPRDAIAAIHRYITSAGDETVRVYAVGGDGILFDCLNGMVDFSNAELTNIPFGNANDFIRGCFGENAKESFLDINKLSQAPVQLVDILRCGSNYAINEVTVGMSSQCVVNANSMLRGKHHKWRDKFIQQIYFLGAVGALWNKELMNQQYEVLLDGKDFSGAYCNIHFSNSPCDGATAIPNPYAKANDGLLDVILAKPKRILPALKPLSDYFKGYFEKYDIFSRIQCKKAELKSDLPICVQMDGEVFYTNEFNIEIIPQRIQFAAPQGIDFADYTYKAYKQKRAKGGNKT